MTPPVLTPLRGNRPRRGTHRRAQGWARLRAWWTLGQVEQESLWSGTSVGPAADSRHLSAPAAAALLVTILGLAVQSIVFAPPGSSVAAWWPAAGVAAGMMLMSAPRQWPWLLLALAVITGVGNLLSGRPPELALVYGPLNAVEAFVFATAIGARRAGPRLQSSADLRRLMLASAFAAATIAALGGAAVSLLVTGGRFWPTAADVAASHAAAFLAVVPLFLAGRGTGWPRIGRWGGAQVAVTFAVTAACFWPSQALPLAFVPVPFIVWSAKILPARVVAVEVVALCGLVTGLTAASGGPFGAAPGLSASTRGALVQVFVVTLAVVAHALVVAVAQRQLALHEAVQTRDLYRRSVKESVIGTLLLNNVGDDLIVLEANAPACDLLGATLEDIVGRPWTAGLTADDRALVHRAERALANGSGESVWERELWLATGRESCVRVALTRLTDTAWGDLVSVQMVDLTEVRLAERALRAERAFSVALMDAVHSAALVGLDDEGRILSFNRGAEEMLAASSRQVLRSPMKDFEAADNDEPLERLLSDVADGRAPQAVDRRWLSANGTRLIVSVSATRVVLPETGDHGFLLLATDVSDSRRTQEALAQALEHERAAVDKLHELDRAKTDLVSSVSHELRTPMTSVMGYLQILLKEDVAGPLTDMQRDLLDRVGRGGRRLLSLIENLLTLSRLESVSESLVHQRVTIADILEGPLEDARAMGDMLGVRVRLVDEVPETWLEGDREQLERALINILSNAVKFSTRRGEVDVRCYVGERGFLCIEVADRGIGIPEDELHRIGEPFFRSSTASSRAVPGTGLGLAIVRTIVHAHGGHVYVTPRGGGGTIVTLVVPGALDTRLVLDAAPAESSP